MKIIINRIVTIEKVTSTPICLCKNTLTYNIDFKDYMLQAFRRSYIITLLADNLNFLRNFRIIIIILILHSIF